MQHAIPVKQQHAGGKDYWPHVATFFAYLELKYSTAGKTAEAKSALQALQKGVAKDSTFAARARELLRERFRIAHSTIQVERQAPDDCTDC